MRGLIFMICVLMMHSLYAQPLLNESLGNYQSIATIAKENKYVMKAANAVIEISPYSVNIIRIHIAKVSITDRFSYAVTAEPDALSNWTMKESTDQLTFESDSLKLVVTKNPVRFNFYTKDNKLINGNDAGFGTSWLGNEVTTYKKLFPKERFIGLGEKTGNLDRRGNGYENWNTDAFGYGTGTDPIYVSIPFYIGLHDSLCYGIFMDNSYKSHFNFGASQNRFSSFSADAGEMDYYFIYHKAVGKIIESYTHLTGRMPMPALWSIGYQQCRYSYYPQDEVVSIAKTFREKKIPCDVIYLDIHYMDHYKLFTWSPVNFPEPKKMQDELKAINFHTTVIVDPGIKIEKGYKAYDDGLSKNIFVKYPDGRDYSGEVWPGWCNFPDFTNPKARKWWGEQFTDMVGKGVDGFWNDMNEIATWGQRLPQLMTVDFDGNKSSMMRGRNIYGMEMARATYEGARSLLNDKRPFVLTRAGFSGVQRYSAVWTGDNQSYDEHMLLGVRLVNSLGISGVANAGYDIGGFTGGSSPQLYARWISIASFTAFMRGHSMINSRSCEPWSYGEEDEEIARNYIQLRYKMMPYLYSSFYEATQTGMPVARSLAIDYTFDDKIYNGDYQNQFLFGNGIMVCPAVSTKELVKTYLPEGTWYDFYNDKPYTGILEMILPNQMNRLCVFVRGGTILPMQSPVEYAAQNPLDTLYVHVYNGASKNSMIYYEDDGDTYQYEKGSYYKRMISFDPTAKQIVFDNAQGKYVSKFKSIKLILHGMDPTEVKVNGNMVSTKIELNNFLNPITKFDPLGAAGQKDFTKNTTVVFKNDNSKITASY